MQTYARKLIRRFGRGTQEKIQNEARAIAKICMSHHKNIVQVINHGWIDDSSYYYIDMELCGPNLSYYIQWRRSPTTDPMFASGDTSTLSLMRYTFSILSDIINGVIHIHKLNEVHRDLKPQNGTDSFIR